MTDNSSSSKWSEMNSLLVTILYAHMVELADTQDLGSCAVGCAGSSPVVGTNVIK